MYQITYDRQYWRKNISLRVSTCWTRPYQMQHKISVQDALCWSRHKIHSVGFKKKRVWTYVHVHIKPDKTSHIWDLNTLVPLHSTFLLPTSNPCDMSANLKWRSNVFKNIEHRSPTHGPPYGVMWPMIIFVNYNWRVKIAPQFQKLCIPLSVIFTHATCEPAQNNSCGPAPNEVGNRLCIITLLQCKPPNKGLFILYNNGMFWKISHELSCCMDTICGPVYLHVLPHTKKDLSLR
jgi:hypothetical protein